MSFKFISIYTIFCIIYCILLPKAASITVQCDFGIKEVNAHIFNHLDTLTDYACEIKSFDWSGTLIQTKIIGNHEAGKSDNDVKIVEKKFWVKKPSVPKFEINFCQKFPNLEAIKLFEMQIEQIDPKAFVNCKNITFLDFEHNKIQDIAEHLLYYKPKLIHLSFYDNQISSIPENAFVNQKELIYLNLGWNNLKSLPPNTFKSLEKLQFLGLKKNQLEALNPIWFKSLTSLRVLHLEQNQISAPPTRIFKSLSALTYLNLAENGIDTLDAGVFEGLENLEIFEFAANGLLELPEGTFSSLKKLKLLTLNDNNLTVIEAGDFGNLDKLTEIRLYNNNIEAIDEKFIENTAIIELDMRENECTQEFIKSRAEMKEKLQKCFDNYKQRSVSAQSGAKNTSANLTLWMQILILCTAIFASNLM